MAIYKLYVKTHTITGLKYLGHTKQNPQKYKGSGKYWTNHLKIHGTDHTTVILFESDYKKEIAEKGEYYSNLWDIVGSNEWANLKPETGDGGGVSGPRPKSKGRKVWNKGLKTGPRSKNAIEKMINTKKRNGTSVYKTESYKKGWETRRKNGNDKPSRETIERQLQTKKENGTLCVLTKASRIKGGKSSKPPKKTTPEVSFLL